MRDHLPPGAKDPWVESRIKEIQTDIATTVPSMPDRWLSNKLQQLSEQDEKAKKEAERKETEATWKKWKKVSPDLSGTAELESARSLTLL